VTVIRVDGVKNTIKTLGYIDPEMKKAFTKNVKEILQPIVSNARGLYGSASFPSGTARSWAPGDREVFPLNRQLAARGVGVQTRGGKRNRSTISVVQRNAGAAVYEFAQNGGLGQAFTSKSGSPARVMWKAATSGTDQVTANLEKYIKEVMDDLNRVLES